MAKDKLTVNAYKLSKNWFDFLLDNPDLVSGNHTALYMWLVELNNRLSWVEKFGISVREGMDGMACKSRKTYTNCLKDLIEWGFVIMIKEGKNQYVCNVIALVKNAQAVVQQIPRHGDSTGTSTDTHPQTNEPLNLETFKTFDVVDDKTLARKKLIEEAIADCERDNTGNVSYPPEAHLLEEKEKSSAKKEKVLPTATEASEMIERSGTCHWWNVIEHHLKEKIPKGAVWDNMSDAEREPVLTERFELFRIFYQQKQDFYKVRMQTWPEIASHFYNWVPIHLNKNNLLQYGQSRKQYTNGNAQNNAAGSRNERNSSIADIVNKSENFLQEFGGEYGA